MCINRKIQSIIDKRALLLPGIKEKKENLEKLNEQIIALDKLIKKITEENDRGQGPYYDMIGADVKTKQAFDRVNTYLVKKLIEEEKGKLDILEKRFNRQALRVAFFGRERQGKSTFIKTITGLNDKVIPAYSGDSCTGAVSVIHNQGDSTRVDVGYYDMEGFLEVVNNKLAKFYESRTIKISRIEDIKTIPPLENGKAALEYEKFKEAYVDHYDEYCHLIGKGLVSFTDENEIARHVSQYEEFPEEVPGSIKRDKNNGRFVYVLKYYKYVAVKSVDIYTPFQIGDMQLLELVDTIGIGGAADNLDVEKEMYRVLREDCDAAIDLFRPEITTQYPQEQKDILINIWNKLGDRTPSKWIVYVVNRIPSGEFVNVAAVDSVMPLVCKYMEANKATQTLPVAWSKDIMGADFDDVSNNLIAPLLDLITLNLSDLDKYLMTDAREKGEELYNAFSTLVNNVEGVMKNSLKNDGNATKLFVQLYKQLRLDFDTELTTLKDKYKREYLNPCTEVASELETVIDGIYDVIPETEEAAIMIARGMALGTVYDIMTDKFCNNIHSAFENVSTDVIVPLRENVKLNIIKVLFDKGKMGKIKLNKYDVNNGPSVEWLNCFIEEKISRDLYPSLYDSLRFVLDYHFNIEDAIESDVATSIGSIDKLNHRDFISLRGYNPSKDGSEADFIFQELANRVPRMQVDLKKFKDRFALMPSHSFATRVNKFHIKVIRDEETNENLKDFYIDNEGIIWREEFRNQVIAQAAFGEWSVVCQTLNDMVRRNLFII